MKYRIPLEPTWNVSRGDVGITDARPVRVSSWVDSADHLGDVRLIPPTSPEFPGWEYGGDVRTPERQRREPHDHEFYEINIIREGVAIHETNTSREELHRGTVIVMAPGQVHIIYGIGELRQTNVSYHAEWLSNDLSALWSKEGLVSAFLAATLFPDAPQRIVPQFHLNEEEMRSADQELADISRECFLSRPSQAFLKLSLLKLLIKLSRVYAPQAKDDMMPGFRHEVIECLSHIEQAILQCATFKVSYLAEYLGLSSNYLTSLFKRETGHSLTDYYQNRRAQHACRMLLDRDLTVTDIALTLGYSDSAHFSHVFKRYRGTSPREYRKTFSGR